jgi:hypothetical protein
MSGLAEFRQQYPQYNDMSDAALADALHSKYYSDIPKQQYLKSIGLAPETQTTPPRQPPPALRALSSVVQGGMNALGFAPPFQGSAGPVESMFGLGSPIARVAKGAVVDPVLSVNQMLAGTGLFGQRIRRGATQMVSGVEEATQQARARAGSEGFDPFQLVGNVISPANRLIGAAQGLQAPGIAAGVGRSAGTGAVMGSLAPVAAPADASQDEVARRRLEQIATGAVLGPVFEGGVKALGAFGSMFRGLTQEGRQRVLREQLDTLAGPDRDRVINELRNAKELVSGSRPTAAEALSDIPSAVELAAAQRKLASSPGTAGMFATRTAEDQAARVRAIERISGTEAQRDALTAARGAVTGPMRETALDLNEIARTSLGNIDRQANQNFNLLVQQVRQSTSPGMADFAIKDLQRTSINAANALKRAQLDSLEQNGVFPLLASDLTNQIDKAIKGAISDESKIVLQAVRNKIMSKADDNGILSSRDVYENVRKMSNQEIANLFNTGSQYASGGIPQQAAKALTNVKTMIDTALDKSSGGLWSKYLGSYKAYSERLNRREIGEYLSRKLQTPLDSERAGVFATAVENAAATIKRSTGIPRFDKLSQVLTPRENAIVNSVLADLRRSSKADELARKVSAVDTSLPDASGAVPQSLNTTIAAARKAFGFLQRGNQEAFNKQMAELMLDPPAMAQFMSFAIPKGRINEVTSAMMKSMDDPTRAAFAQVFAIPTIDAAQPLFGQQQ